MDRPRLIGRATIDLAEHSAFRLGRSLVDPLAREIRYGDNSERIEPQPMKVLVALADRRGEVVTRDELIDSCWDGRVVGDDVINRTILLLRRVARTSDAFSIETVPKSGYRLIEIKQAALPKPRVLASLVAIVALLAVGLLLVRGRADQSHPPLAVIELAPFTASGGAIASETAKASDAVVADMLANSGLPVLKPHGTSPQGKPADLRLSGQVRAVGGHLEADLQLDDLAHGTLLLSRRFSVSSDQAKNLPEQIGAFAATSLASTGALMALDPHRPGDPRLTGEVLRQLSMGVVFEDSVGTYRAVDRIAPQMPDSAIAQLGLALSTAHALPLLAPQDRPAALAKGRAAAARARALAPNFGDTALPDCKLYSPVRMAQCEAAMRKAFAIDPDSPFAAAWLRNQLVDVGRFREALDYDRLAVAAMPYMAGRLSASTNLLEGVGDRIRAEQQFQRVRRWWPEFDLIFGDRIEGILDRGSIEDAAAFIASIPPDVEVIDRAAVAEIAADVRAKRIADVRTRCTAPERGLDYFCLVALIRTDDLDGAFAMADRMFPKLVGANASEEDRLFLQHPGRLGLGALSAPALVVLREDPRFIPIAERVGLMRYWRETHLPDFCTLKHEPVCRVITRH